MEQTFSKTIIISLISFVVGVGLTVLVVSSGAIKIGPTETVGTQTGTVPVENKNIPTAEKKILVPRSLASADYYTYINESVKDVNTSGALTSELATVLTEIDTRNKQKNYTGFFDIVVKAKTLVKEGEQGVTKFTNDINGLSVAKGSLRDKEVISATEAFISASIGYRDALSAYFTSANSMLSGDIPDKKTIDNYVATVSKLNTAGKIVLEKGSAIITILDKKTKEATTSVR